MKEKLLLVVLFSAMFGTGVLIGKTYYDPDQEQRDSDFVHYDQYDPEYMNYTDDQMLEMCEKHNAIYDFENGECIMEGDMQWEK